MRQRFQSAGEAIKAKLEERGWTQADLATILGIYLPDVNGIIQGKRSITPNMAVALGAAFGSPPDYWLSLDATHRLSLIEPNQQVEKRAKLFSLAPVKDMARRGWITKTDSTDDLERELCKFFNVDSLEQEPKIHVNARQPFTTAALNPSQLAWCFRAARLAAVIGAERFKPSNFESALPEVRQLADYPEKAKHLPKLLGKMGVRLVVIEPLPHSKIDGAAFWLASDAPVIVLSLRYDRIDCLWFTLAHEMMHILHGDAQSVDSRLIGEDRVHLTESIEERANKGASSFLIPNDNMRSFMLRVKPFYSKPKIIQFAIRMQVHPGIVVGQLQHRGEIRWEANRDMLAKIRDVATSTALTDGWGKTAPTL